MYNLFLAGGFERGGGLRKLCVLGRERTNQGKRREGLKFNFAEVIDLAQGCRLHLFAL